MFLLPKATDYEDFGILDGQGNEDPTYTHIYIFISTHACTLVYVSLYVHTHMGGCLNYGPILSLVNITAVS